MWRILALLLILASTISSEDPGFWEVELAPTHLMMLDYNGFHLPIWEHQRNKELKNDLLKRYYLTPPVEIIAKDTRTIYNTLTESHELELHFLMWSDYIHNLAHQELRKYLRKGIQKHQVQPYPIEKVRLSYLKDASKSAYRFTEKLLSHTDLGSRLRLSIGCQTKSSCEILERALKRDASFVETTLALEYVTSGRTSARRVLSVRGEHVNKGKTINKLNTMNNTFGSIRYLMADDYNKVISEITSNVVADEVTDGDYLDSNERLSLQALIEAELPKKEEDSRRMSDQMWTSVFWSKNFTRPDFTTSFLNKLFKKDEVLNKGISTSESKDRTKLTLGVDEETGKKFSDWKERQTSAGGGIDVAFKGVEVGVNGEGMSGKGHKNTRESAWGEGRVTGNEEKGRKYVQSSELNKWLKARDSQVEWTGEKFEVKPMKLNRMNLADLSRKTVITTHSVVVHKHKTVQSLKVKPLKCPDVALFTRSEEQKNPVQNDDEADTKPEISVRSEPGFWEVEVAPASLLSVPYHGFHLPVWEHMRNNETSDTSRRRYYVTPPVELLPESVRMIENPFSGDIEIDAQFRMWSDDIRASVMTELTRIVGYPVGKYQVLPYPFEKVRLQAAKDITSNVRLSENWTPGNDLSDLLRLSIECLQRSPCERIRDNLKQDPNFVEYSMVLEYYTTGKSAARRSITIKGEHLRKGKMKAKLDNMPSTEKGVRYMTADDYNSFVSEIATNVIADETRDAEYLSSADQLSIKKIILNELPKQEVNAKLLSDKSWESVFWDQDFTRPDITTKTLNQIAEKDSKLTDLWNKNEREDNKVDIIKVNKKTLEARSKEEQRTRGGGGGVSAGLAGVFKVGLTAKANSKKLWGHATEDSKKTDYNKATDNDRYYYTDSKKLNEWLKENKAEVQWTGRRFDVKSMSLNRINIADLTQRSTITTRSVQVQRIKSVHGLKIKPLRKNGDPQACQRKIDVTDPCKTTKDIFSLPLYCLDVCKGVRQGIRQIPVLKKDVVCENNWMVLQRRTYPFPQNMEQNWQAYKNGFGDKAGSGDYWGGLEVPAQISTKADMKMRIELTESNGAEKWAEYSKFRLGLEAQKYQLEVDGYSGSTNDLLKCGPHGNENDRYSVNKKQFYTKDREINSRYKCASMEGAGWWYNHWICGTTNLNADFNARRSRGRMIQYYNCERSVYHLRKTKMLYKPKV